MSRWLAEKAACETWVTESSNSSLHSFTVTSLISTPKQTQICFMPIIFMLSSCSAVKFQGVACPWALSSALRESCPCCHLSWERDKAPAWATSRTRCWAVLKGLGMACAPQVTSLNSHQPGSRWRTALETLQLDRCTRDVQCWMQPWCFFWLPGGDSNHNYGSPSPESFLPGPKGYCTSRFCAVFSGPHLSCSVFSAKISFPSEPSIFSLYLLTGEFLSPLPVDLLGLLLSVGSPGHSKGNTLLQTTIRKRDIFYLLTK